LAAFALSETLRVEAIESQTTLSAIGATLRQATAHFVSYYEQSSKNCNVAECVKALLRAREEDECSQRYLGDLRLRLRKFEEQFGKVAMSRLPLAKLTGGCEICMLEALFMVQIQAG